MDTSKKLEMLEEMMELEEGFLKPEMLLEDIEEWDSMSSLALIVLMDETFDKQIAGAEIKRLRTVQDILDLME